MPVSLQLGCSPPPRNASTSCVETIRLTSLLRRQRLHNCTAIWCVSFQAIHRCDSSSCAWLLTIQSFVDGAAVSTAGYVKLLLPPRQSRGNSRLGDCSPFSGAAGAASATHRFPLRKDEPHLTFAVHRTPDIQLSAVETRHRGDTIRVARLGFTVCGAIRAVAPPCPGQVPAESNFL